VARAEIKQQVTGKKEVTSEANYGTKGREKLAAP
jgi:hypothetical protein